MTVTINTSFDVTQREFITDLAWIAYQNSGYKAPTRSENPNYFWDSAHPQERAMISLAENIFELLTGDSPSYDDDPDEDDDECEN